MLDISINKSMCNAFSRVIEKLLLLMKYIFAK